MEYVSVKKGEDGKIAALSKLATAIVREHYDPIIGKEQNTYMLGLFQSVEGINRQLDDGYHCYVAVCDGEDVGYLSFCEHGNELYLSKLYLRKDCRGKGLGRDMVEFVKSEARALGLNKITLNVNKRNGTIAIYEKLGFVRVGEEKNSIGRGYYMDDYVYSLTL